MGFDARVRYTKMVIRENFLSLLEEEPINKVTVKAICDGAQINRATFYRHYLDAFDLLDQLEEELLSGLREAMAHLLEQGSENTLEQILTMMKENASLYGTLVKHGDPGLPHKVFKACYGATSEYIADRYPALSEERRAWLYSYVAQGASGVLECWIAEGMHDDPKEVAAFIERLIESNLTAL